MPPEIRRYAKINRIADITFYVGAVLSAVFGLVRLYMGTTGNTGATMWTHLFIAVVSIAAGVIGIVVTSKAKKLGYRKLSHLQGMIREDREAKSLNL